MCNMDKFPEYVRTRAGASKQKMEATAAQLNPHEPFIVFMDSMGAHNVRDVTKAIQR